MKKSIIISLCMLAIAFALQAQDEKLRVAVFDPTSSGTSIDEGTKIAVRELISSTFVNTGKYSIVERSLLDKVMKEQAFSNTDVVDESQATELGRLAGANKVILSVVTLVGGRNMLSVKVIDVQTATVEQQKTKIVNSNDLLDVVEPLTLELMGEKASTETIVEPSNKQELPNSSPILQIPSLYTPSGRVPFLAIINGSLYLFVDKLVYSSEKEKITIELSKILGHQRISTTLILETSEGTKTFLSSRRDIELMRENIVKLMEQKK